jgi:hypothetical protein
MALTNTLKTQVDVPVWEWCRFAPTATTAISALTTAKVMPTRYLYYQVSGTLYRYDTWTDSWHQLQSCQNTAPTIMAANAYSSAVGHYGRAIGGGGGNDKIQLAGMSGNTLVGYKIRIIGGTGAGQERTITAVAAPVVADRGVVTTAGTSSIADASTGVGLKQWKVNQWRDYQIRADYGTGRTIVKPILYNNANTITWSDAGHLTVNPWASNLAATSFSATAGSQALYVIESHIVTVDTNWTTNPDSTSQFVILSGGIWTITQGTTSSPYFCLQYYDVLADQWYGKSTQTGIKAAVFTSASDLSLEVMTEVNGAVVGDATATSGAARSLTNSGLAMTPNIYANYEIRIVSGTGIGQVRTILSNTATVFNVTRDWATNPDNTSHYEIWRDTGKLWLIGGGDAGMLQYSQETDQWTTGKQLDFGQVNQLAATRSGQNPFALTSITRTATGISVLNATPTVAGSGYNVDDILTITTGGSGGTARVLTVDAVGGVTSVALETCGTGYTTGTGKATTAAPTGGTGCTLNITTVDYTELCVTPLNHNFTIGDTVTISGATGTGAANFNGVKTIIGVPSATQFSYCTGGDPGAATATVTGTLSTTQLVDCTKNWTVNEHAGKIIQVSNNVLLATSAQQRVIVSNTANTITWTLAMSASTPANGTYRYVILDKKPFGAEMSLGGRRGGGIEGFATGGSSTTLVDSTKNWQTNYFSRTLGRKVRIVEGTGVGNEITIVSNTATTLTYTTQSFTPDTTTRYEIMDCVGLVSAAGGIATVASAPTAGGSGYAVGDISAVTGGSAQVRVLSVSGGIVQTIQLIQGGVSGYTVTSGVATTNVVGTGTGLTVNVTAITAAGSTTVLSDNTKNWDVNVWAGKKVRFMSGTGVGQEFPVVSNTATTLTYAAITTAPDASTAYAILEAAPKTFGLHLDMITNSTDTTINSAYMYAFSGSATPEISRYKVCSEHWELMSYFPQSETLTTGAMYCYDQADRIYINLSTTAGVNGRIVYYDLVKNIIVPSSTVPYGHSTAVSGNRMEIITTTDGLKYLYVMRHSGTEMWRTLIYW